MTIAEMVDYLDLLQDKFGSPYFTTSEKERFLNQAQLAIISEHLPKDGVGTDVERNANSWMIFSPLSFSTTTTMSAGGVITKASLESTLTTAMGFPVSILRPLSVSWTDADGTRPVKGPTRQNNWATYLNNVFKVPVNSEPRYYEEADSYTISPIDVTATITIKGIRYPKAISVAGAQTAELASIYHNDIVAQALSDMGIGSRDQMLVELQKVTGK